MVIIVAAAGWMCGLLLAAYEAPLLLQGGAALAVGGVGALSSLRGRSFSAALLAVLLLAAAALGAARFRAHARGLQESDVARFTGRSIVALRGSVSDEPIAYGSGWEFPIVATSMEKSGDWVGAHGTLMVRGVATAPYRVGDELEVRGVLLPPDPSLPAYLSPLRQESIAAVASRPTLAPLGTRDASPLVWIATRREDAALALNQALPEPEAGLARGIALGERRTLPPDLDADFQRTNTSHILAVDGFKVGLVSSVAASALGAVVAPLLAAAGTTLGIGAYVVFVGGTPSAVRAGIMGGIFALGRALGRPGDTLNALALAALAMTALNPFLLWALAFQLSFATTAGLALLVPVVDRWLPTSLLPPGHGTVRGGLREALVTTLAAEVASAPLVVASFQQVSILSLPVHAVVMPLLPFAIGLSALTAALGLLAAPLGNVVGLGAWVPLAAIVGTIQGAGGLPFAALSIPPLGLGWVVGVYVVLGLALFSGSNPFFGAGLPLGALWSRLAGIVPVRVLVPGLVVPAALGIALVASQHRPVNRITFLAEGDSALVELDDGGRLFLQGNAGAARVAAAIEPGLPLGDRRLDLAVLTAANDDALTDLGDLSQRLSIQRVVRPATGFSMVAKKRWQGIAAARQVGDAPGGGGAVRLGNATLTVYALDGVPKEGRSAAVEPSLAVLVAIGPARTLWVSALPSDQARLVGSGVPSGALSAGVLKLVGRSPRWGIDPAFFQAVNPGVVILPSGAADRYAKPAPGTLDLLADRQVFRTDLDGPVEIELQANGIAVRRLR